MSRTDGQPWRKSTASNGGNGCVEMRLVKDRIEVRDSKLGGESPILSFTAHEIECLAEGFAGGEFADLIEAAGARAQTETVGPSGQAHSMRPSPHAEQVQEHSSR